MEIKIKESGEVTELSCILDNVDQARDIVGDAENITYDNDEEIYVTDQSTFDWWEEYLKNYKNDEERKAELIEEYGYEVVEEAIDKSFLGVSEYDEHHNANEIAFEEIESL